MRNQGPYWPDGFFAELLELAEAGNLQDGLDTDRLVEMYQRAAEELTGPIIDNPGRALAEERGQRAAFEARLAARWGRSLDLFDLTVEQALEAGRWINTRWRPGAAARQDQKFEALIRLHGRAVMTANEVQVLCGRVMPPERSPGGGPSMRSGSSPPCWAITVRRFLGATWFTTPSRA